MKKSNSVFIALIIFGLMMHQSKADTCDPPLFSWENTLSGWVTATDISNNCGQTTLYSETTFASDGSYSLRMALDHVSGDQGIFKIESLYDFSAYDTLKLDVYKPTGASADPQYLAISLSTGSSWAWYQATPASLSSQTTTVTFNLKSSDWNLAYTTYTYSVADLNQVQRIAIIAQPTITGFWELYADNMRLCKNAVTPTTVPPTVAPTKAPTKAPTAPPTVAPTKAPTTAPPTKAPTTAPPTVAPTKAPTAPPTVAVPTKAPTLAPTATPTTKAPTAPPTVAPTKAPTKAPTVAPTAAPTKAPTKPPASSSGFVGRSGTNFILNGCPFYFMGTNNYYVSYQTSQSADSVFRDAVAMKLTVLRTWAFIDIGSITSGSPIYSLDGMKNGIYFQYWNDATGSPAVNTGATGLQNLDYVIKKASDSGIKLILTLVNNWHDFGGMDQYVVWYSLTYHDQFYTDSNVRQAFKNYISTILNRVNSITGVVYKNDPTIMAWELANEPRCQGDNKGTSSSCNTGTITTWVTEMSQYIKSIDSNHLVAVGDEGWFSGSTLGSGWMYDGSNGIDHNALLAVSTIDFGTTHLYPDSWSEPYSWGPTWIQQHITAANNANKPAILEEFGAKDTTNRASIYSSWLGTVVSGNEAGTLYWMLASSINGGSVYPDYDGFTVYNDGSAAATTITGISTTMMSKNTGCSGSTTIPTTLPPLATPVAGPSAPNACPNFNLGVTQSTSASGLTLQFYANTVSGQSAVTSLQLSFSSVVGSTTFSLWYLTSIGSTSWQVVLPTPNGTPQLPTTAWNFGLTVNPVQTISWTINNIQTANGVCNSVSGSAAVYTGTTS